MKTTKKRSLNEYRQSKEYGYTNPTTVKRNSTETRIITLIKKFPNNSELGEAVRRQFTITERVDNEGVG
jgi:hypothetical protein